jgi:hypothetical protein
MKNIRLLIFYAKNQQCWFRRPFWGGLLKTNIPFGGFHSAAGLVLEEFEKRPKRMTKRLLFNYD